MSAERPAPNDPDPQPPRAGGSAPREGKPEPAFAEASAYRSAGVDLDAGREAVAAIRALVSSTRTPRVESEIGVFAGFFAYPEPGSERLLVASMDGVGTKLKIAAALGRWHDVGYDIVSHCVGDILVHGALPLFFLDYIGAGRLEPPVVREVVAGIAEACRESQCALIGGETAEMPGMYPPGELDLVGTIIGEVRRDRLVDGRGIEPGDRILGLRSLGLHTNGYSLARSILGSDQNPAALAEIVPGSGSTAGDLLLRRHRNYLPLIRPLLEGGGIKGTAPATGGGIKGMAHITGGGISENLPRILPPGVRAVVLRDAWEPPPIFRFLCERGGIDADERYRVFNMGIGFLLVLAPDSARAAIERLREAGESPVEVGWCEPGAASVRWTSAESESGNRG